MKIAICEEGVKDLALLRQYCRRYDQRIAVENFPTVTALLAAFQDDFYDIVLMAANKGMEAEQSLMKLGKQPYILFTACNPPYITPGHTQCCLCHVLSYERFSATLRVIEDKARAERHIIRSEGKRVVVRLRDIVYVDVSSHCVRYHMRDGSSIVERNTLSALMEELPPRRFVQTQKSFCVNLGYVRQVSGGTIVMAEGTKIPLSRHKITEFHRLLCEFTEYEKFLA